MDDMLAQLMNDVPVYAVEDKAMWLWTKRRKTAFAASAGCTGGRTCEGAQRFEAASSSAAPATIVTMLAQRGMVTFFSSATDS